MTRPHAFVSAPLVFTLAAASGQTPGRPESVVIRSGSATLHAMLWRPQGRGRFPAILLNHGSGRTGEEVQRLGPFSWHWGVFVVVLAAVVLAPQALKPARK